MAGLTELPPGGPTANSESSQANIGRHRQHDVVRAEQRLLHFDHAKPKIRSLLVVDEHAVALAHAVPVGAPHDTTPSLDSERRRAG